MNCETCRESILNSDDPRLLLALGTISGDHMSRCPSCYQFAHDLISIETAWRSIPDHPHAETSKQNFLNRRYYSLGSGRAGSPQRSYVINNSRWFTAVCLFIALGSLVLFFWPTEKTATARPDLIDKLVDWNLELSEAATCLDREKIFKDHSQALHDLLRSEKLSEKDAFLARQLLENGTWFAHHEDPIEELLRLNQLADDLLKRVLETRSDARRSKKFARQFRKVHERGIDRKLEQMKSRLLPKSSSEWKALKHARCYSGASGSRQTTMSN